MTIDLAIEAGDWPPEEALRHLVEAAVDATFAEIANAAAMDAELSVVFTDDAHIRSLNSQWRGKDSATNVLSFPAAAPMLGDIVLAAETVAREAAAESKPFDDHLTHLIVHGLLHLLGHDHEEDAEAEAMEAIERRALRRLAINDPYA